MTTFCLSFFLFCMCSGSSVNLDVSFVKQNLENLVMLIDEQETCKLKNFILALKNGGGVILCGCIRKGLCFLEPSSSVPVFFLWVCVTFPTVVFLY